VTNQLKPLHGNADSMAPDHRYFDGGAYRDLDENKLDYEGFLHPAVLEAFSAYMHTHRKQADGSLRSSDNWQKGIFVEAYRKSLLRHVMTAWKLWRGWKVAPESIGGVMRPPTMLECLCGILFNTQGLILEALKQAREPGYIIYEKGALPDLLHNVSGMGNALRGAKE